MRGVVLSYVLTIALLGTVGGIIAWVVFFPSKNTSFSPLPSFLTLAANNQVTSLDLFRPMVAGAKSDLAGANTLSQPQVSAKAALVFDLTTQKTLFAKNERTQFPIASLTKIMTAIIALENKRSDNTYTVRREHLVGENSMGLSEGEILTLEDLLYGLMLPSGNDAAEVLASYYSGGREALINAMNQKASSLGLNDTNFTNPSGLEGEGNQYSSAYDLLVITNYALSRFPLFQKVVATYKHIIPYSEKHKAFYLYNETNLLTSYPGVKGVKTGYTPEAGLCLVTYFEHGNHRIVAVLLGSNNRRAEMRELLDYALRTLGVTPPKPS